MAVQVAVTRNKGFATIVIVWLWEVNLSNKDE